MSENDHLCKHCFNNDFQISMALPAYAVDQDAVLNSSSNDVQWRHGLPNYSKTKALFEKHKTKHHQAGSLEDIVQNLVKNWEKGITPYQ